MRLGVTAMAVLLSNACTDQVIGEFGDTGSTSTAPNSDESVSTAGENSASTTTADPGGTSTSTSAGESETAGPIPTDEVCDGADNDLDGLVDEVSPTNSTCGGCSLLQGAGQAWWVCDDKLLDWEAATTFCGSLGAATATVTNEPTQVFLEDTFDAAWYWLSVRQEPNEGAWLWPDGSSVAYANWGGQQPDNWTPDQNCVRLTLGLIDPPDWFHGAWDDFECASKLAVLCSATHTLE